MASGPETFERREADPPDPSALRDATPRPTRAGAVRLFGEIPEDFRAEHGSQFIDGRGVERLRGPIADDTREGKSSSSIRVRRSSIGRPFRKQTSASGCGSSTGPSAVAVRVRAQEFLEEERIDGQPDRLGVGVPSRRDGGSQRIAAVVETVDLADLVDHLGEGIHRKAAVGIGVDQQLRAGRDQRADFRIEQAMTVDRILAVAVRHRQPLLDPAGGRQRSRDRRRATIRSSSAARKNVVMPPPDRPVAPIRLRSRSGRVTR